MNDHQLTKYIYVKVMDIFPLQALHVCRGNKGFWSGETNDPLFDFCESRA